MSDSGARTRERPAHAGPVEVRRFRLTALDGPSAGAAAESAGDRCAVGQHPLNDLVLADETVSRFHCELRVEPRGVRLVDLGSRNGSEVDGVPVNDGYLRDGSLLRLGATTLRFDLCGRSNRLPLSARAEFGRLVGRSVAMRATFHLLERAAATTTTVLLAGETGTGKSAAAEAIHRAGPRRDGPFVVIDCGAIPAGLLESELFGHERGAFTSAAARRVGAFEEAAGGTILLDEIGEVPVELQPKLLRALENREIRRVGGNGYQPIDVRLIAATHRDLREEVNAGRFRSDLYYRLAVVRIPLPSLRERREDVAPIAAQILAGLGVDADQTAALLAPAFLAALEQAAWPGNVRELRNHLERCLFYQDAVVPAPELAPAAAAAAIDPSVPFSEARRRALVSFERAYLDALLQRHGGRVAEAARAIGVHRVHLHRLIRQRGLRAG